MKKLVACLLCLLVLLSCFCFTSCDLLEKMGKVDEEFSPEEAVKTAVQILKDSERYAKSSDYTLSVGVGFLSKSISAEGLITERYENENFHMGFHAESIDLSISNELVQEVLDKLKNGIGYSELWFCDGTYYLRNENIKTKFSANHNFSVTGTDFNHLLDNFFDNLSDYECHKDKSGKYYIVAEIAETSFYNSNKGDITVTLYFNEDGSFSKILETTKASLYKIEATHHYTYNSAVAPITPPADADQYKFGN